MPMPRREKTTDGESLSFTIILIPGTHLGHWLVLEIDCGGCEEIDGHRSICSLSIQEPSATCIFPSWEGTIK
jgi:hypothetical protein